MLGRHLTGNAFFSLLSSSWQRQLRLCSVIGFSSIHLRVLGGFVFLVAITRDMLLPLNRLRMQFGLFLGSIISPLALGLVFFSIFTPLAVFFRVSGRDELRLRYSIQEAVGRPGVLTIFQTILSSSFKEDHSMELLSDLFAFACSFSSVSVKNKLSYTIDERFRQRLNFTHQV